MRAIWTLRHVALLLGILAIVAAIAADDSPFVGKLPPEPKPPEPKKVSRAERVPDDHQDPDEPLAEILIEGNERIRTEDILALMRTRPGQRIDSKRIKSDVRRLVETRWFSTVEPRIVRSEKGLALLYRVAERDSVAAEIKTESKPA